MCWKYLASQLASMETETVCFKHFPILLQTSAVFWFLIYGLWAGNFEKALWTKRLDKIYNAIDSALPAKTPGLMRCIGLPCFISSRFQKEMMNGNMALHLMNDYTNLWPHYQALALLICAIISPQPQPSCFAKMMLISIPISVFNDNVIHVHSFRNLSGNIFSTLPTGLFVKLAALRVLWVYHLNPEYLINSVWCQPNVFVCIAQDFFFQQLQIYVNFLRLSSNDSALAIMF